MSVSGRGAAQSEAGGTAGKLEQVGSVHGVLWGTLVHGAITTLCTLKYLATLLCSL